MEQCIEHLQMLITGKIVNHHKISFKQKIWKIKE